MFHYYIGNQFQKTQLIYHNAFNIELINRNQQFQKYAYMVQFTFDGLFKTTNKGLPDTSNLDPYSYLSLNYFIWSIILQVTILIVFIAFLILSISRVLNQIKNQKFIQDDKQEESEDQKASQKQKQSNEEQGNTNDNLIYKFDEEEQAKQKQEDQAKPENEEVQNQSNQDNQQEVDSETNQQFLQMDHKFLTYQPFIIGFVMMNSTFSMGPFGLVCLGSSLLCYILFNIKQYAKNIKILQTAYMIPAFLVLFSIFFNDLDMST